MKQPKLRVRLSEENAAAAVTLAEYGASAMLNDATGLSTRADAAQAERVATELKEAVEAAKQPLRSNFG